MHSQTGEDAEFVHLAGLDVHVKRRGSTGPTVILLHHFHGNSLTFERLMRELEPDHRSVAFDRPGFGFTERPSRSDWNGRNPYRRATSLRILEELVARENADATVIVGSSSGTTLAMEFALANPHGVDALILIAPVANGDVGLPPPIRPLFRFELMTSLLATLAKSRAKKIGHARVGRSWFDAMRVTDEDVANYVRPMHSPGWARSVAEVMVVDRPPFLSRRLGEIRVPTLVINGDNDRTIEPRHARRIAAALPNGEYAEVPRCGHTPHEERPREVAKLIRTFVAKACG